MVWWFGGLVAWCAIGREGEMESDPKNHPMVLSQRSLQFLVSRSWWPITLAGGFLEGWFH